MAIVRHDPFRQLSNWEPFREIGSLQREMNSLFDRLTSGFDRELSEFSFTPSAEIEETDDEICLKLKIPGKVFTARAVHCSDYRCKHESN
jgi:HSP20 family protein